MPHPFLQLTPSIDTHPEYDEHVRTLMRTRGRRAAHAQVTEVTGQCQVCLDLFSVPVALSARREFTVVGTSPRLRVRPSPQGSRAPLTLFHTHPHATTLPDGQVKLYGSLEILQEKLSVQAPHNDAL